MFFGAKRRMADSFPTIDADDSPAAPPRQSPGKWGRFYLFF